MTLSCEYNTSSPTSGHDRSGSPEPTPVWHADEQPSPLTVFPSSQISPAVVLIVPSPHARAVQFASHVSVSPLPSHVSTAAELMKPSPQAADVQLESDVGVLPPPSQVSPVSRMPSPQKARRQVVRHASGFTLLLDPSLSHCSTPPDGPDVQ